MITRRSFWSVLSGSVAAAPAVVAAATPALPAALIIAGPICPSCCNTQEIPSRWTFETQEEWHAAMTTPTTIVCNNPQCRTAMTVTFAR